MTETTHSPPEGFAWLTGPGPAAIAVLRLAGPHAAAFFLRHFRRRSGRDFTDLPVGSVATSQFVDSDGVMLDDVLVIWCASHPCFDVHVHFHGNPWLIRQCEQLLCAAGVSPLPPCALFWTTHDRIESAALALLPQMSTLAGARWLSGQISLVRNAMMKIARGPREDAMRIARQMIESAVVFDWFAKPLRIALVGPPNAGKSTLINAIADRPASVVSAYPGTTRDFVEVLSEIEGFPAIWIDTAGLRVADDALEAAGIARTTKILDEADAVVAIVDVSVEGREALRSFVSTYRTMRPVCVALNKVDLLSDSKDPDEARALVAGAIVELPEEWRPIAIPISARNHGGLGELATRILAGTGRPNDRLAQVCAFDANMRNAIENPVRKKDYNSLSENALAYLEPS